jgi:hypothetical protein
VTLHGHLLPQRCSGCAGLAEQTCYRRIPGARLQVEGATLEPANAPGTALVPYRPRFGQLPCRLKGDALAH